MTVKEVYDSVLEAEILLNKIKADMKLGYYKKNKANLGIVIGILQGVRQRLDKMRGWR